MNSMIIWWTVGQAAKCVLYDPEVLPNFSKYMAKISKKNFFWGATAQPHTHMGGKGEFLRERGGE